MHIYRVFQWVSQWCNYQWFHVMNYLYFPAAYITSGSPSQPGLSPWVPMSPHDSRERVWGVSLRHQGGVGGETKEVMGAYLGVFVFPRGGGDSICVWPCDLLHAFLKGSDSQAFRCMRRWLTRLRNRASKTRCFCGVLAYSVALLLRQEDEIQADVCYHKWLAD